MTGSLLAVDSRPAPPGPSRADFAPPALEHLEPRLHLSIFTYQPLTDFLDQHGIVHDVEPPGQLTAASSNLQYLFWTPVIPHTDRPSFAVINGEFMPLEDVPGLEADDIVRAVSDTGVIVVQPRGGGGEPPLGNIFVIDAGVRFTLDTLVIVLQGPPDADYDRFFPVGISNNGDIVFNEVAAAADQPDRAWMLRSGFLTFLWEGAVADINEAGDTVGMRLEPDGSRVPVLRTLQGDITILSGLETAQQVNNLGHVAGTTPRVGLISPTPALWRNGEVTSLGAGRGLTAAGTPTWTIVDLDDHDRIAAVVRWAVTRTTNIDAYLFTPDSGLALLDRRIFGGLPAGGPGEVSPIRLAEDGRIAVNTGVLHPVPLQAAWTLPPDGPLDASTSNQGLNLVAVSELGDQIFLRDWTGDWLGSRIRGPIAPIRDIISYHDGLPYAFIFTDDTVLWARPTLEPQTELITIAFPPVPTPAGDVRTPIVANQTLFQMASGRYILAGTNPDGHVVIYYQLGIADPGNVLNWGYDNLTLNHIIASGQTFTPVAGNLVGFSAAWGSHHLAYLDDAGQVHAIWIPGGGTQWQTVNLSQIAGAPPLMGTLTAFITPWNAMHINAVDAAGEMVSLWWAPGFAGSWRADAFAPAGAPRLEPHSVSSFITPWHTLTFVGLDADTGHLTSYWWSPAATAWAAEQIKVEGVPEDLALAGPVRAAVGPDGQLNLFARQDNGHIARFFWNIGDGDTWSYQDVTQAATLQA